MRTYLIVAIMVATAAMMIVASYLQAYLRRKELARRGRIRPVLRKNKDLSP